ncbi:hypothetical protein B0H19DRAFT_1274657 [Mycena capillaripes]|nr:hypothetical protein B0H19DRAFT_1274657 [Mycena capillaripes]
MNTAGVSLPNANPVAADLNPKLKACGECAAATGADILPTEDDAKMLSSFRGLVMTLLLAYCPGSKEWEDHDLMLKAAEDAMESDRPLSPEKSDGRPFGIFNANEGSMLKALQGISGLGVDTTQ